MKPISFIEALAKPCGRRGGRPSILQGRPFPSSSGGACSVTTIFSGDFARASVVSICAFSAFAAACVLAAAPDTPGELTSKEKNLAQVRSLDRERIKAYSGQENFRVRPGLVADKTGRVVRVTAESIKLPGGSPVEFPLITANSGKDYEAHALSFASALDVHDALEFIGLTPGHGVDSERLQFWPKGDRVAITFHYREPGSTNEIHVPAARLTLDSRTGKSLPENGFVFTGSEWIDVTEPATSKVYAADAFTPNCIVAYYNESTTVLDVPRRASQNSVYSCQVPNPAFLLPSNQLIEVTLEPYFKDNRPHEFNCVLTVAPGAASTHSTELVYSLQDQAGQPVNTNRTLNGFLASLEWLSVEEQVPFVTFMPDDHLSLASVVKVARLLDGLDTERGIRVEAPPNGHPYFRTFLPNEPFRKREDRPSAASELYLGTGSGGTTGMVVLLDMEWKGDDSVPTFSETRISVPRADQLISALTSKAEVPAVVLVFAPASMEYGVLRGFIAPLLQRKTILYVFTETKL